MSSPVKRLKGEGLSYDAVALGCGGGGFDAVAAMFEEDNVDSIADMSNEVDAIAAMFFGGSEEYLDQVGWAR